MKLTNGIEEHHEIQKIANENPDKAIIVLDSGSKIVFTNETFIDTTGYNLEEVKGRNPLNLGIGENSPEEFLCMLDEMNKGKTFIGAFRNIKKNGEEYYTETYIVPIYENISKIAYYIAMSSIINGNKKRANPEANA